MTRISDLYTSEVHKNLKPLYGNWEPSKPIQLGDYGFLDGYSFNYLGNVNQLGLSFDERSGEGLSRKNFSSNNLTEIGFHAKGKKFINAALEINFKSSNSVFFNASGCEYSHMLDLTKLGRNIIDLYRKNIWQFNWCVITDIIRSKSTTIIISTGNNSSIVLEAAEVEGIIDLADVSVKLSVSSQKNVGFQTITQDGLSPLFGLSKIQKPFLSSPAFNPFSLSRGKGKGVEGEEALESERVYFGRLLVQ